MNIPGISFNEADSKVLLVSQPTPERTPVDGASLRALLLDRGWGACFIDEAAVVKAASMCNMQTEPFGLQVAQRLDATVSVHCAADDMTALLDITPAYGGQAASVADVMAALAQAEVVYGIDQAAVAKACQAGQCSALVVARGTLPEDGQDASFETLVPDTVEREPKVGEDGLIDYREHGIIPVVAAGTALMRHTPATRGVDGRTVKGRELPAKPGHEAAFASKLDGAEVSRDDPNLLVASVSGQPVRVACGVNVEPILRVKEVNMASGNIHFDGTVHVSGEVVQGMKVQASGDIVVDGIVDGGVLEAGGNIQVAGGVIAHARLTAGAAVNARFAQGVSITAGTLIAIGDAALDCELQSLNQIIIGTNAPERGRLVGGSATAAMLLRTPLLGSNKAGATRVVMGSNPELQTKYTALLKLIEEHKANEANLEKIVKQLKAIGDPKGMLERVKASRQHAVQVWGESLVQKEALEHEMALALGARVEVSVAVEGALDLSFGPKTTHLRREFDAGTFSLDAEGHWQFTGTDGKPQPLAC